MSVSCGFAHTACTAAIRPRGSLVRKCMGCQKKFSIIQVRNLCKLGKNVSLREILKGLNSTNFFEILNSNTKFGKDSVHQLKIAFKRLNFVRKTFLICWENCPPKTLPSLDFKNLNFKDFWFILHYKYPINQKRFTLSG
jgi:hypothetical protein